MDFELNHHIPIPSYKIDNSKHSIFCLLRPCSTTNRQCPYRSSSSLAVTTTQQQNNPKQQEQLDKMAGAGKKAAGSSKPKAVRSRTVQAGTKQSRSDRAGILFPVGRVQRLLRSAVHKRRVSATAPVYLAAVLEYLVAELLEVSANAATEAKVKRISPRHLLLAIREDKELNAMFHGITIAQAGVKPFILPQLLQSKKAARKTPASTKSSGREARKSASTKSSGKEARKSASTKSSGREARKSASTKSGGRGRKAQRG